MMKICNVATTLLLAVAALALTACRTHREAHAHTATAEVAAASSDFEAAAKVSTIDQLSSDSELDMAGIDIIFISPTPDLADSIVPMTRAHPAHIHIDRATLRASSAATSLSSADFSAAGTENSQAAAVSEAENDVVKNSEPTKSSLFAPILFVVILFGLCVIIWRSRR